MRENYDGSTGGLGFEVLFDPAELVLAEFPQTFLDPNIDQPQEVHALVVEAVPAAAVGALAIALQIPLAIIRGDVMFAGHIKDLLRPGLLKDLVHHVELAGLRRVAEVAGMNEKLRLVVERIDLIYCTLQSAVHVGVCRAIEPDVTVANLHKSQVAFGGLPPLSKCFRGRDPSADGPHNASPSPSHALEETAAVDTILVDIFNNAFKQCCLLEQQVSAASEK